MTTVVVQHEDSLDAAWAEAEAALPAGHWTLHLWQDQGVCIIRCDARQGFEEMGRYSAEGDTPAAALRALAAKLREVPR